MTLPVWEVEGQERAIRLVQGALEEGRLHHAYLLLGPPHVGKMTLARHMAQAVNCTGPAPPCGGCNQCHRIEAGHHVDVQVVGLEAADGERARVEIGIDRIRDVQHIASLQPFEGTHRVFIIDGAEHLSEEAANCLLKTVEEPPPAVLLLLLTSCEDDIPATLVSRCQRLEVRPLPTSQVLSLLQERFGVEQERAKELAHLSRGCLGWAIRAAQEPAILEEYRKEIQRVAALTQATVRERFAYAEEVAQLFQRDRQAAQERLYQWLRWWRDLLLIKTGLPEEIAHLSWRRQLQEMAHHYSTDDILATLLAILATLQALDRTANARLALEVLMLRLPAPESPARVS